MYNFDEAKAKFNFAKQKHDSLRERNNKRFEQYYTGITAHDKKDNCKVVYNFTKELINSQVSSDVPLPLVSPRIKNEKNEERARMISAFLKSEVNRLQFKSLNDKLERLTHVCSGVGVVVEWDATETTAVTKGELKLTALSPSYIIPQPFVDDLENLDYIFVVRNNTKRRIFDIYGKDVSDEGVDTEFSQFNDSGSTEGNELDSDELVTLVLMFFRNRDKIGHIAWVGDVELCRYDDYYARKDLVCAKCQETKGVDKVCRCGSRKFVSRDRDGETLEEDFINIFGRKEADDGKQVSESNVIKADIIAKDKDGELLTELAPAFDDFGQQLVVGGIPVIDEVPMMTKQKIPYYQIRDIPFSIRKNEVKDGEFFGVSDCDDISGLQHEANVAKDKSTDKTKNAAYIVTVPQEKSFEIKNIIQTVELSPEQMSAINAIPLEFDTSRDAATVSTAYAQAKAVLGITDAFQGKASYAGESAAARESMIAQSSGMQKATHVLKNDFYADLYKKMFQMYLAFADEPREYVSKGKDGKDETYIFSRYDFLEYDEFGNLYYEDGFLFSIDESGINSNNRLEYINKIKEEYTTGSFGDPTSAETRLMYWRLLEKAEYPFAGEMVEFWDKKVEEEKALLEQQRQQQALEQQLLQQGQSLPPELGASADVLQGAEQTAQVGAETLPSGV